MKVVAYGKCFKYLKGMESHDEIVFHQNAKDDFAIDCIKDGTELVCLDREHTNYNILCQLANKGINVFCQGLWRIEDYLEVIREFKKNNKFVIEDESFLRFEKINIFIKLANKLLMEDPLSIIEIKTSIFDIYAALRILRTILPETRQLTIQQHVKKDNKEWFWCNLKAGMIVLEVDKIKFNGLGQRYTAKTIEFNIQTKYGTLSLRGYFGPILWEAHFPRFSNNEELKGYLFHPIVQVLDSNNDFEYYLDGTYRDALIAELKEIRCFIKENKSFMPKMQKQIFDINFCHEIMSCIGKDIPAEKKYYPLRIEELSDQRERRCIVEDKNEFSGFSLSYLQYSVNRRKEVLVQTILLYMHKKGVLTKGVSYTFNQILQALSVCKDNNGIIFKWLELLKSSQYVEENDGRYICMADISENNIKIGWEEIKYLWKDKLESPLVLDYLINNIKNWDNLIQKKQNASLLLFEQGDNTYADALYKDTKILQYLNSILSGFIIDYLKKISNAIILEIGAGTGATSDVVLKDIYKNNLLERITYIYTDISKYFLQKAKERYTVYKEKADIYYHTLNIDKTFSGQLDDKLKVDIVIAVGVLNNSVDTDKCIHEINNIMKPGGILLIIETVEDVPDILVSQSFMMSIPKDRRKNTNTIFLDAKQWLDILGENGFSDIVECPKYGDYLEILGQKLFCCTKE